MKVRDFKSNTLSKFAFRLCLMSMALLWFYPASARASVIALFCGDQNDLDIVGKIVFVDATNNRVLLSKTLPSDAALARYVFEASGYLFGVLEPREPNSNKPETVVVRFNFKTGDFDRSEILPFSTYRAMEFDSTAGRLWLIRDDLSRNDNWYHELFVIENLMGEPWVKETKESPPSVTDYTRLASGLVIQRVPKTDKLVVFHRNFDFYSSADERNGTLIGEIHDPFLGTTQHTTRKLETANEIILIRLYPEFSIKMYEKETLNLKKSCVSFQGVEVIEPGNGVKECFSSDSRQLVLIEIEALSRTPIVMPDETKTITGLTCYRADIDTCDLRFLARNEFRGFICDRVISFGNSDRNVLIGGMNVLASNGVHVDGVLVNYALETNEWQVLPHLEGGPITAIEEIAPENEALLRNYLSTAGQP